jgi:hypothetical protein
MVLLGRHSALLHWIISQEVREPGERVLESYSRGLRRHRRSCKAVQDLSGFAKKRKKKTAGK